MAHILEHLYARRSIRRYTQEGVPDEVLVALLKAAMAAPSASNRKPWEFIVVTDKAVLDRLRRPLVLGHYDAPAAIVVCGNTRRAIPSVGKDYWVQDCSAATQNILLAACGMGLGTVWIGVHPVPPLRWAVSRALGIPRHIIPLGVVYVGHPAEVKEPRTQYRADRVHWQRYGDGRRAAVDEVPEGEHAGEETQQRA